MPCYGIPPNELADPADISIPVQGHFGLDDGMVGFSSKADAFELRNKLQKNSAANLVFFYPNAGHAFLNDLPDAIERKQALGQGEHNAVSLGATAATPYSVCGICGTSTCPVFKLLWSAWESDKRHARML